MVTKIRCYFTECEYETKVTCQILDAIDTPHCQRLEQPDACPTEYYALMLQCWEHEPANRPKFSDIITVLPEIKPERVQCIGDCGDGQVDHIQYKMGDIITVLNKRPPEYPDGYYWKGSTEAGRTGLFLPRNSVTYLGTDVPGIGGFIGRESGQNNLLKESGISLSRSGSSGSTFGHLRSSFSRNKPKLSRSMISAPQGDFRHTGHVAADGSGFGGVSSIQTPQPLSRSSDLDQQPVPPPVNRDKIPKLMVAPLQKTDSATTCSSGSGQSSVETVIHRGPGISTSNSNCLPLISASFDRSQLPATNAPSTKVNTSSLDTIIASLSSQPRPQGRVTVSSTTSETADLLPRSGARIGSEDKDVVTHFQIPDLDAVPDRVTFENRACIDTGLSLVDDVFDTLRSLNNSMDEDDGRGNIGAFNNTASRSDHPNTVIDPLATSEPTSPASVPSPMYSSDTAMLLGRPRATANEQATSNVAKAQATVKPLTSSDMKLLDEFCSSVEKVARNDLRSEAERTRAAMVAARSFDDVTSLGDVDESEARTKDFSSITSWMKRSLKLKHHSGNGKRTFTENIDQASRELETLSQNTDVYKALVDTKPVEREPKTNLAVCNQPTDTASDGKSSEARKLSVSETVAAFESKLCGRATNTESKPLPRGQDGSDPSSGNNQSAPDEAQGVAIIPARKTFVARKIWGTTTQISGSNVASEGNTKREEAIEEAADELVHEQHFNPLKLLRSGGGASIVRSFRAGSGRRHNNFSGDRTESNGIGTCLSVSPTKSLTKSQSSSGNVVRQAPPNDMSNSISNPSKSIEISKRYSRPKPFDGAALEMSDIQQSPDQNDDTQPTSLESPLFDVKNWTQHLGFNSANIPHSTSTDNDGSPQGITSGSILPQHTHTVVSPPPVPPKPKRRSKPAPPAVLPPKKFWSGTEHAPATVMAQSPATTMTADSSVYKVAKFPDHNMPLSSTTNNELLPTGATAFPSNAAAVPVPSTSISLSSLNAHLDDIINL